VRRDLDLCIVLLRWAALRWDAETASKGCEVSRDGRTMWIGTADMLTSKEDVSERRSVQSTYSLQDCVGEWKLNVQMPGERLCVVYIGGSHSSLVKTEGKLRRTESDIAQDSFRVIYNHDDFRLSLSRARLWECESAQCGLFDHFALVCSGPCIVSIQDVM
jgi:hypothetical protein